VNFVMPEQNEDPWRGHAAWRIGRADQPAAWLRAGRQHHATVTARLDGQGVNVSIAERTLSVRLLDRASPHKLSVNGHGIVIFDRTDWLVVEWQGKSYRLGRPGPLSIEDTIGDRGTATGSGRLTAPMPGRIVKIAVELGQQVRSNQPLVVLEAMKMEHVVEAPHSGTVKELCVEVGQQVTSGAVLLELGDEG
jgi:3-methylcrotonyl-CoA carboxylase alpha subunit